MNLHNAVALPPEDSVTLEGHEAVSPEDDVTVRVTGPASPERLFTLIEVLPDEPAANETVDAERPKSMTVTGRIIE